MEVNEQMTVCRSLAYGIIEVDHLLIRTVHEVDLNACGTPFLVDVKCAFDVCCQRIPKSPENDAYALLAAVVDDFLNVDFGFVMLDIECTGRPAFVE